jgi:hypothetical protein
MCFPWQRTGIDLVDSKESSANFSLRTYERGRARARADPSARGFQTMRRASNAQLVPFQVD